MPPGRSRQLARRGLDDPRQLVESPTMSRFPAARIESAVFAHQKGRALQHRQVEQETQAGAGFEGNVGRGTTLRAVVEKGRGVAGTGTPVPRPGANGPV